MARKKASTQTAKVRWVCNKCGAEYDAGKQSFECPVCGETMDVERLNDDGLPSKAIREAVVGGKNMDLKRSDDLDNELKTKMLDEQFRELLSETIQDQRLNRAKALGLKAKLEALEMERKLKELEESDKPKEEEPNGMAMPFFGGQNIWKELGEMPEDARKDLLDRLEKNPQMMMMFAMAMNPNAKMNMQGQMPFNPMSMMGMNPMMMGMPPMMGMMPQPQPQEEKEEKSETNRISETVAMMKMMMDMVKSNAPPPPDNTLAKELMEKVEKLSDTVVNQRLEAIQNSPQVSEERVAQLVNSAIERTVAPLVQQRSLPEQIQEILQLKEGLKEIGLVSDPHEGVVKDLELEEKRLELEWKKEQRRQEKEQAARLMELELQKIREENDLFTNIITSVVQDDDENGSNGGSTPAKRKSSATAVVT